MRRPLPHLTAAGGLLLTLGLAGCADDSVPDALTSDGVEGDISTGSGGETDIEVADDIATGEELTTTVVRSDGQELGTVTVRADGEGVVVSADLDGFEGPGFHGFHLHEDAVCDPDDEGPFESAGGHLGGDDADHADHAGDLSSLLATDDGRAVLQVRTDRVSFDQLADDGAALIVHADPDNHGHIPDRYTAEGASEPGPDADTLDTGDAGDRLACGVLGADES